MKFLLYIISYLPHCPYIPVGICFILSYTNGLLLYLSAAPRVVLHSDRQDKSTLHHQEPLPPWSNQCVHFIADYWLVNPPWHEYVCAFKIFAPVFCAISWPTHKRFSRTGSSITDQARGMAFFWLLHSLLDKSWKVGVLPAGSWWLSLKNDIAFVGEFTFAVSFISVLTRRYVEVLEYFSSSPGMIFALW